MAKPKLGSGERFATLSRKVMQEYEKKGMSPEKAKEVGRAVAAKVGMKKWGKRRMLKLAKAGRE